MQLFWFASPLGFCPSLPKDCDMSFWLLDRVNKDDLETLSIIGMTLEYLPYSQIFNVELTKSSNKKKKIKKKKITPFFSTYVICK